jgi:exodeoxyribonuclease VII small subunit
VTLTRACREALETVEQRVRILTEGRPDATPEPFSTPQKATTDQP